MLLPLCAFGMTAPAATTNHGIDMKDAIGSVGKLIIRGLKKISFFD